MPGAVLFEVRPHPTDATDGFDAVISGFQFNPANGAPLRDTRGCIDFAPRNATEQAVFTVGRDSIGDSRSADTTHRTESNAEYDYFQYSLTFYRDTDGDRVYDDSDLCACKTTPGDRADGCATPGRAARCRRRWCLRRRAGHSALGENSRATGQQQPRQWLRGLRQAAAGRGPRLGNGLRARRADASSPTGIKVTGLLVKDIDRGTKVEVSCSSRRTCKKKTTAAGRRGRVEFDALAGKKLRPGQSVTLRVTGGALDGKVIDWQARARGKKGVNKTTRCIDPKSKRVRPCKSVSTLR